MSDNDSIKIEKNIPLPPGQGGPPGGIRKYPLDKMEVNDSFLVCAKNGEDSRKLQRRVSPTISYYGKKQGRNLLQE